MTLPETPDQVAAFLRHHLRPVSQPHLADDRGVCPVFHNVVSSTKMEPLDASGRPAPIRLLRLLQACPTPRSRADSAH